MRVGGWAGVSGYLRRNTGTVGIVEGTASGGASGKDLLVVEGNDGGDGGFTSLLGHFNGN